MSEDAFGNWDEPEAQPKQLTVEYIDRLVARLRELRQQKDEATEKLCQITAAIANVEKDIVANLNDCNKTSWDVEGIGKVFIRNNFAVRNPKTPEAKKAFYDYLKARGLFEDLATINHQTLNAFYKTEREQAEGDPSFNLPGLEAPTLHQSVVLKKG